ncbi:MAG: aldehyde dehydrogenase family protein [Patescibacteria group bacterium]
MRLPSKRAFRREADAVMAGESYPDFKSEVVQKRLDQAHSALHLDYLHGVWPHVLAGKEYYSAAPAYADTNPYFGDSLNSPRLGLFQRFDPKWDITGAIGNIDKAQDIWRETPWKVRAEYLYNLAHKLMGDKWTWRFVSALMHDTGKSAAEAWGEYNEVYRFVFAHIWYMFKRYTERDHFKNIATAGDYFGYSYKGRGIGLVVAPFNFPAAIPVRMLTLMLAFGNVGILKGATTASLVTLLIYDICEEVRKETGIGPAGLVNFAPGSGGTAVDAFLSDPRLKIVSFTGSSEVCQGMISKHMYEPRIGGNQLTVGSAETGGVNWVVLKEHQDLDWFAAQCIKGNFGISGQKCSTTRLVFIPEKLGLEVLSRLAAAYDRLTYGNVLEGADLGPVIDINAKNEIDKKIAFLEQSGIAKVAYRKEIALSPSGQDVAPVILVAEIDAIRDMTKIRTLLDTEIFGPVLTLVAYRSIDEVHALRLLSEYGLTGSYYDENPEGLADGMMFLPAGNAYGNRRSTGATAPESFGGLGGSKSSYNSGLKGYDEVALYVHTRTHTAVYPKSWTEKEKRKFRERMEQHGVAVKY